MSTSRGWGGALISVLEGIAASKTQPAPDPAGPNVVTLQIDVKKLVDQIRTARRDEAAAKTKRAQLTEAWAELDQELIADEMKTAERVLQLQIQFAKVAHDDCGLDCVLPPAIQQDDKS